MPIPTVVASRVVVPPEAKVPWAKIELPTVTSASVALAPLFDVGRRATHDYGPTRTVGTGDADRVTIHRADLAYEARLFDVDAPRCCRPLRRGMTRT